MFRISDINVVSIIDKDNNVANIFPVTYLNYENLEKYKKTDLSVDRNCSLVFTSFKLLMFLVSLRFVGLNAIIGYYFRVC